MKELTSKKIKFTIHVILIHTTSYIACGLLFHLFFDYNAIFNMNIIKDFMRPVSDPMVMMGPFLQPIRGLLFAIVLWLLRPVWVEKKYGWLYIWIFILILGIINTPAASPCSIEGFIYSRIPFWYHIMGYAELGIQTLVFSSIVFSFGRNKKNNINFLSKYPKIGELFRAAALSCLAYIGYALGSIASLFITGSTIEFKESTVSLGSGTNVVNIESAANDLTVQFMFLWVFLLNIIFVWIYNCFFKKKNVKAPFLFIMIMCVNILGLIFYQFLFSDIMPVGVLFIITLLPTIILTFGIKNNLFINKKGNV